MRQVIFEIICRQQQRTEKSTTNLTPFATTSFVRKCQPPHVTLLYRHILSQISLNGKSFSRVDKYFFVCYNIAINRYIDNKLEHGLSPINKCVNDLFGIRIICDGEIDFEDLQNHINCSYGLKCINAAKADYIATHIYFKRDNYSFPWELQV